MVYGALLGGICLLSAIDTPMAPVAGVSATVVVPHAATTATDPDRQAAAPLIPALTPVSLEIGADLGSAISKSGDTFPIRLHEPIVVNGQVVVAAGAVGMGEVVHAKHHGMSGSEGQLIIAARWVDAGGQHLRLRSMHMVVTGKDSTRTANALGMASAVGGPLVAVVGLLISGADVSIPKGSVAEAKTAEDFFPAHPDVAPPADAVAAPVPAAPANLPVQTERTQS